MTNDIDRFIINNRQIAKTNNSLKEWGKERGREERKNE